MTKQTSKGNGGGGEETATTPWAGRRPLGCGFWHATKTLRGLGEIAPDAPVGGSAVFVQNTSASPEGILAELPTPVSRHKKEYKKTVRSSS